MRLSRLQNDKEGVKYFSNPPLLSLPAPSAVAAEFQDCGFASLPLLPEFLFAEPASKDAEQRITETRRMMSREVLEAVAVAAGPDMDALLNFHRIHQSMTTSPPVDVIPLHGLCDRLLGLGMGQTIPYSEIEPEIQREDVLSKTLWLICHNIGRLLALHAGKDLPYHPFGLPVLSFLQAVQKGRCEISASFFGPGYFQAKAVKEPGKTNPAKYSNEAAAAALTQCDWKTAIVVSNEGERVSLPPPPPHNLNTLQQEMCRRGHAPETVREAALALYKKGVITWPLTDAKLLSSHMLELVMDILLGIHAHFPVEVDALISLHEEKATNLVWVQDTEPLSPIAIIPTTQHVARDTLSDIEADIYHAVCKGFIRSLLPNAVGTTRRVWVQCGRIVFFAEDTFCDTPGWRGIEGVWPRRSPLEGLEEGGIVVPAKITPSQPFDGTMRSLLNHLDAVGMGFAAQAEGFEWLVRNDLVSMHPLYVTAPGEGLVEHFHRAEKNAPELKTFGSLSKLVRWMNDAGTDVERVGKVLQTIATDLERAREVRTPCPNCGGKIETLVGRFECENHRRGACNFQVHGVINRYQITPKLLTELVTNHVSAEQYELYSPKKEKYYKAQLQLDTASWRVRPFFPEKSPA